MITVQARHLRAVAAVTAAALGVLGGVAAAVPEAGDRYRGTTSQDRPVKIRVSGSGTGLQMTFREKFRCRGRRDVVLNARYVNDRPTIRPDGTFDYRKTYRGLRDPQLGRFANTQRLSGRFLDGDNRVTVRSVSRVFNRRYSCRSEITIRARRI